MQDPVMITSIWLFVIVFMFHDFEEILTVEKWADSKKHLIDHPLKRIIWRFWNIDSHSFAKRDVWILFITSTVTLLKVIGFGNAWVDGLYFCFLLVVMIHNVVHILQSIVLKTYSPGLYTAVFLLLPYTSYLLISLSEV